ncbi:MAG: hypothetical protein ABFD49_01730 [Armatimonadota bacterium]|nr:hypothetical protein [bacterium]
MEIPDIDAFVENLADAVVKRIDEREKINLIAEAVLDRIREKESDNKET